MNEPTHIDLFSGIGGFALAAAWAGFRTVAFCDIEPYAQALLQKRFGAVMADADSSRISPGGEDSGMGRQQEPPSIWGDIRNLDGRHYRGSALLTGGFPCQPFSVAGKRAGAADDRFLWPEMLRVISEAEPAWVLGENVAGIIAMELDRVLSDLEGIGYECWPLIIPACAVDARHRRDRVWIVGHSWSRARGSGLRKTWTEFHGPESGNPGCALADAGAEGFQGAQQAELRGARWRIEGRAASQCCQWPIEPAVGRVAHGIPGRLDRLKGLGNAIVPQVAYELLREIRKLI